MFSGHCLLQVLGTVECALIYFQAICRKRPLNRALVSFDLVCANVHTLVVSCVDVLYQSRDWLGRLCLTWSIVMWNIQQSPSVVCGWGLKHVMSSLMCGNVTGELLSTVDTRQMNNTYGCVSPCGRFVASSGLSCYLSLSPHLSVVSPVHLYGCVSPCGRFVASSGLSCYLSSSHHLSVVSPVHLYGYVSVSNGALGTSSQGLLENWELDRPWPTRW